MMTYDPTNPAIYKTMPPIIATHVPFGHICRTLVLIDTSKIFDPTIAYYHEPSTYGPHNVGIIYEGYYNIGLW